MLRLRHTMRLARELAGFAVVNRSLWFVPLVLLLVLLVALTTAGSAAAPYTIYTIF